jgi:hypothetical protein
MQVTNPASSFPWSDTNPSPFSAGDTLASVVSAGQDQPSVLTPPAIWLDAVAATYRVSFSNAQTAALLPEIYRMMTTASRGGRSAVIGNVRLEVLSAAGSAASIPVYGTYADMLLYCSWIGDLQDDSDEAGFLGQRGRARSWLDDILVSRFKWGGGGQLGDPGSFSFFSGGGGGSGDPWQTKTFRGYLAANTGVAGTTALICYDQVREIVSRRAIYHVLDAQVNRTDGSNPFKSLGREYRNEADGLVKLLRAEIDTTGTGYATYIINCGATDLR